MAIINGNPVNSSYTNTKLVSKLANDEQLLGTYDLKNALSGDEIVNVQQTINDTIADVATNTLGIAANDVKISENLNLINQVIADIASGTKKIKQFASDVDYINASPALVGGEIYYNTATGQLRYYDNIEDQWRPVGQQIVGIQENIGLGNGVTDQYTITNAPLNDESIIVFVNGRAIQKNQYSILLPNVTFNVAPAIGADIYVFYLSEGSPASPIVSTGTPNVVYKTVSGADVTAKQFTLPTLPASPLLVVVDYIDAGFPLEYGAAFIVTGDVLSWNGLLLDGTILSGDKLRIQYFN